MNYRYEEIFSDIKDALERGTILPLEKLPSLRKSARKYGCAISVVIQAYNRLEGLGLISSVEKSGFIVNRKSAVPMPNPEMAEHTLIPNMTTVNLMTSEIVDRAMDKTILPFGAAIPDASLIASRKLAGYISRSGKNRAELFSMYTASYGSENLRKEIAKFMFKRGVSAGLKDIVITNGCSEALYISLKILTSPGDTVAIESPTYFSLISILEELKIKVLEIPTRADSGLDMEGLTRAVEGREIKALVFSSTFQNPLCSIMDGASLKRLHALSLKYGFTLIEDDIYGDCSFDGKVYQPLKALDKENRVIYCSSFSKTISPGIRIGWALPGINTDRFREVKQISCLGGPAILQEALADYLADGCYEAHIKSFRKKIYQQTYKIRALIEEFFPEGIKVTRPQGGFFLWVEFPEGFDSLKLYRMAYENRIGIVPGPVFSVIENYVNAVRISCGAEVTEEIVEGIRKLGELAKSMLSVPMGHFSSASRLQTVMT